jgi:prefoldin subunit 5
MDTQQIFEELKEPLGDVAARSLSRTFAAVYEELRDAVTRADFRILRESIDDNVSRLEHGLATLAEAQGRTEHRVEELTEAQARTEIRIQELTEAQAQTEASLKQLTEAQARTESRLETLAGDVSQLTAAQRVTEQALSRLVESEGQMQQALTRLTIRTDSVVGRTLELQFRDRIASYLGLFMRRCRLVDTAELIDALEPHLDRRELADVIRADAIASGQIDGMPSHVVVEVSAAADVDDIERAHRRAGLLRRAGVEAVPIVACEVISPESRAYAMQAGVLIWLDGRIVETGEAA